ncbi:MAG: V-type ATP synthase subunit E [Bacillota bacterium]
MEGIDRIKERILKDARQQADQELEEAEDQAEQIKVRADKDAGSRKEELVTRAETEAEDTRERIISMAELEMRKKRLATKQEMIQKAFDKALERLKNLDAEEYEDLLIGMILDNLESGQEEIILSPHDREQLSDKFLDKLQQAADRELNLKLAEETREIEGGFILSGEGIESNNSFESLIRIEKSEIETKIAELLFQE